jgi:thiamine phosphate synthase YjbQ (UPF0047 family)
MGEAAELRVRTSRKIERLDVTKRIEKALEGLDAGDGALLVSTPHTTASIVVGEAWDPDVTGDMDRARERCAWRCWGRGAGRSSTACAAR